MRGRTINEVTIHTNQGDNQQNKQKLPSSSILARST